jgi:hypothetical protein
MLEHASSLPCRHLSIRTLTIDLLPVRQIALIHAKLSSLGIGVMKYKNKSKEKKMQWGKLIKRPLA